MHNKLIVILGPTASGKSSLAIKLARKFKGEIISADSRQVYKGMDIGTGKVTAAEQKLVPHYLLDVASPKKQFSVADFQLMAKNATAQILHNGKIPFLVGGTAFYIYSLVDGWDLPQAKPNPKLRKRLEKKSVAELFLILKNLDPKRALSIDKNNPTRLIRAIEINVQTGRPVPDFSKNTLDKSQNILFLGIKKAPEKLCALIDKRVDDRLKLGMITEVKRLRKSGLSFKRLESFGLEYKFIAQFLQNKLEYSDMVEKLKTAIWQFSKRQMTWFKKDSRIHWIQNNKQAELLIRKFLR